MSNADREIPALESLDNAGIWVNLVSRINRYHRIWISRSLSETDDKFYLHVSVSEAFPRCRNVHFHVGRLDSPSL